MSAVPGGTMRTRTTEDGAPADPAAPVAVLPAVHASVVVLLRDACGGRW